MLADWGIHHLHLSSTLRPEEFTERGRDLLFAVFHPTDQERQAESKAGISGSLFEIDGHVYGMLGQTAPGIPMPVAMRVQELMWRLWDLRENLDERLEQYLAPAEERAGRKLSGDWAPAVYDGFAGLKRDDVFVQLGR
jgi:hypothetical protein